MTREISLSKSKVENTIFIIGATFLTTFFLIFITASILEYSTIAIINDDTGLNECYESVLFEEIKCYASQDGAQDAIFMRLISLGFFFAFDLIIIGWVIYDRQCKVKFSWSK